MSAGRRDRSTGLSRTWNVLPKALRVTIVLLVVGGAAFGATVLPFIAEGGPVHAEIAGGHPEGGRIGARIHFHASIDNTSGSTIRHLCLGVRTDRRIDGAAVQFQGTDVVAVGGDNFACGGLLSAQETASVEVSFTPAEQGTYTLTMLPADDRRTIGATLVRRFVVTR